MDFHKREFWMSEVGDVNKPGTKEKGLENGAKVPCCWERWVAEGRSQIKLAKAQKRYIGRGN